MFRAVINCHFYLGKLPWDEQTCEIDVGLYSQTLAEVNLTWTDNNDEGALAGLEHQVTAEWFIGEQHAENRIHKGAAGDYALAVATFKLTRNPLHHEKKILKSCIFVLISYLGVWIDAEAAPARVALALLMILIVMTQIEMVESKLPNVSYHIWLADFQLGCLIFNILCFFSYVLVNYGARQHRKVLKIRSSEAQKATPKLTPAPPRSAPDAPATSHTPDTLHHARAGAGGNAGGQPGGDATAGAGAVPPGAAVMCDIGFASQLEPGLGQLPDQGHGNYLFYHAPSASANGADLSKFMDSDSAGGGGAKAERVSVAVMGEALGAGALGSRWNKWDSWVDETHSAVETEQHVQWLKRKAVLKNVDHYLHVVLPVAFGIYVGVMYALWGTSMYSDHENHSAPGH